MHTLLEVIKESLFITMFVIVIMLLVEYINVVTQGKIANLKTTRFKQYVISVVLGIIPGCLGGFAAAAMYSHGAITLGAIVATMIATSGDEAFVMFAMFPVVAIYLNIALATIGIAAGYCTDIIFKKHVHAEHCCDGLVVHDEIPFMHYTLENILSLWKNLSLSRASLMSLLAVALLLIVSGFFHQEEGFIKIALPVIITIAIIIVAIVPEHFLQEHLWEHVIKRHLLRIFLWTLSALIVIHLLVDIMHLDSLIHSARWVILIIAALIGVIPESGPHLLFVVMFAKGLVPLSVLVTSSIVQDGHTMLPLLAQSRKDFLLIKGINLIVGLIVGSIIMAAGY
ncbi:MAG: arsenic efflux protein [Spirochaetes bacterium]|nr:arsenic efflux protein [Spirochaetota bacterium]